MTVIVRFDRIGRVRPVVPLRLREERLVDEDAERISEKILAYARPMLFSRDVYVAVDVAHKVGTIFVGVYRNGGAFTLTQEDDDP